MKIRIQDFGPIRDFTFDLDKDLHLLYGKNGTGKSYAIYCVYAVLKNLAKDIEVFLKDQSALASFQSDLVNRGISDLKAEKESNSTELVDRSILQRFIVDNLDLSFKSSYERLFDLNNNYSRKSFRITLHTDSCQIQIGVSKQQTLTITDFEIADAPSLYNLNRDTRTQLLEEIAAATVGHRIGSVLASVAGVIEQSATLHFLPASRSGLYQGLNSFAPIIAELSKQRHLIRKKIALPTLSETVSDYFLALSSIEKLEANKTLESVVGNIETNILNGEVSYSTDDRKITFKPKDTDLNLDLAASSSMVAELSPIVTYLRYIIKDHKKEGGNEPETANKASDSYDILFIEEPEAHLHPEAQVKLMEILAELTQHNIKVVMTSHSDYMFNKLTNLILEKKVNPDTVATYHMVMTDQGSVVQDDMPVTSEGIEDSNFLTVAEQLYEERMRLASEMTE